MNGTGTQRERARISTAAATGGGADAAGPGAGGGATTLAQPASSAPPRIAANRKGRTRKARSDMWVILLEALAALALLVLIVWWTMFHGRHRGERRGPDDPRR